LREKEWLAKELSSSWGEKNQKNVSQKSKSPDFFQISLAKTASIGFSRSRTF
jgi:hypothetical protein